MSEKKKAHVIKDFQPTGYDLGKELKDELQILVNKSTPEIMIPTKLFEKFKYSLSIFQIFDLISIMKKSGEYPIKER